MILKIGDSVVRRVALANDIKLPKDISHITQKCRLMHSMARHPLNTHLHSLRADEIVLSALKQI